MILNGTVVDLISHHWLPNRLEHNKMAFFLSQGLMENRRDKSNSKKRGEQSKQRPCNKSYYL